MIGISVDATFAFFRNTLGSLSPPILGLYITVGVTAVVVFQWYWVDPFRTAVPVWRQTSQMLDKFAPKMGLTAVLVRGTILNRTYGTYDNLYIWLFLGTIFGPVYSGPP